MRFGALPGQFDDDAAAARLPLAHAATDGVTTIEIADEGPGIPLAERERVFERFHRVDAARAARDGGTGLGLAIARWIVDAHGGTICVREREPKGCRFVVELPR